MTPTGKVVPDAKSPLYTEQIKWPKWNGTHSRVHLAINGRPAGRALVAQQYFNLWAVVDHEYAARRHGAEVIKFARTYDNTVKAAWKKYGEKGPLIAGIMQDHWPEDVKAKLHHLLGEIGPRRDAAIAHWVAAHPRTPPHTLPAFRYAHYTLRVPPGTPGLDGLSSALDTFFSGGPRP